MDVADEVIEQLGVVRESGMTNMMSYLGVMDVASDLGLTELESFCIDLDCMGAGKRNDLWLEVLDRL